jgi:hypothetical protein
MRLAFSDASYDLSDESSIASLPQIPQGGDQCVNLLASVVKGEGGAQRALQEPVPQIQTWI